MLGHLKPIIGPYCVSSMYHGPTGIKKKKKQ